MPKLNIELSCSEYRMLRDWAVEDYNYDDEDAPKKLVKEILLRSGETIEWKI